MIYTHKELKNTYDTDYQIQKAIKDGKLYKIEAGIYSDTKYYNNLEVIVKKYPDAVITMNAAFYFHDLTDVIPSKINLATKRNALRIKNDDIVQKFISDDLFEVGKSQIVVEDTIVNIYDKERMLIELVRNKKQTPIDYYKEIIKNYRRNVNTLDMYKLQEYIEQFPNTEYIYDTIMMEVF